MKNALQKIFVCSLLFSTNLAFAEAKLEVTARDRIENSDGTTSLTLPRVRWRDGKYYFLTPEGHDGFAWYQFHPFFAKELDRVCQAFGLRYWTYNGQQSGVSLQKNYSGQALQLPGGRGTSPSVFPRVDLKGESIVNMIRCRSVEDIISGVSEAIHTEHKGEYTHIYMPSILWDGQRWPIDAEEGQVLGRKRYATSICKLFGYGKGHEMLSDSINNIPGGDRYNQVVTLQGPVGSYYSWSHGKTIVTEVVCSDPMTSKEITRMRDRFWGWFRKQTE